MNKQIHKNHLFFERATEKNRYDFTETNHYPLRIVLNKLNYKCESACLMNNIYYVQTFFKKSDSAKDTYIFIRQISF